jgi:hypothetical protein
LALVLAAAVMDGDFGFSTAALMLLSALRAPTMLLGDVRSRLIKRDLRSQLGVEVGRGGLGGGGAPAIILFGIPHDAEQILERHLAKRRCSGGRTVPMVASDIFCVSADWRWFLRQSTEPGIPTLYRAGMAGKQTRDQCMMYCNSWQGSAKTAMSQLRSFTSRAFRPAFLC